jgi:hypothetical protein
MKPSILLQLDTDPHPSVFDAVVAIDAGADHLLPHGGIQPDHVRDLVHGLLFTRGPADLHRSAIFIGGSDVATGEALLHAVKNTFFGPFRVSVLLDSNGSNTTAAAAVLAAIEGAHKTRGSIDDAIVTVLAATGPVGQRVARLLLGLTPQGQVRIASRKLDRAQALADTLEQATGRRPTPFATASKDDLHAALDGAQIAIAAGAAGITLLPQSTWSHLDSLQVLIDLNAVPPLGIEGVEPTDQSTDRHGRLAWGALGVGGTKMKIHRRAIERLFTSNDQILDTDAVFALARDLASKS